MAKSKRAQVLMEPIEYQKLEDIARSESCKERRSRNPDVAAPPSFVYMVGLRITSAPETDVGTSRLHVLPVERL